MSDRYQFILDKDVLVDSIPPFYLTLTNNGIVIGNETKCKVYQNKSSTSAPSYIAHAESPLEFVGTSIHDSISSGTHYYVGIVENSSNRIRIFPTPLIHMERVLKRDREEAEEEKEIETSSENQPNVRAQRVALGSAFGTKKAKKMFDSVSKNKIDVELLEDTATVLSSSVHTATETLNTQRTQGKADDAMYLSPLPPHDPEAQKPAQIYPLHKMMKTELLEELKSITLTLTGGTPADALRKFQSLFTDAPLCPTEALTKGKPVSLYFHFLARMLHMDKRTLVTSESLAKFLNCSERMAYLLIDSVFPPANKQAAASTSGSFHSFSSKKHKLTPQALLRISLFAILASLHMMDFRVSLQFLSDTMKLSLTQVSKYAKQCGCHLESNTGTSYAKHVGLSYAVLKMPLVFPDMNYSSKKKGAPR